MSKYLEQFDHKILNIGTVVNPHKEMIVLDHTDELYDAIYGELDPPSHYTVEGSERFKEWCKEHNVYYYGRPAESFVQQWGLDKAREAGAVAVILENMS